MKDVKVYAQNILPKKADDGCSGYDLHAFIQNNIVIHPGKCELVPTGLFMNIPKGYEAQVRSRSGIALKNKVFVLNSPGTIDSSYNGEIKIILFNLGDEPFVVAPNSRVAQLVFSKIESPYFECVGELDELSKSNRGSKGFGSTGVE
jgi:dUTP pyrophosphatase